MYNSTKHFKEEEETCLLLFFSVFLGTLILTNCNDVIIFHESFIRPAHTGLKLRLVSFRPSNIISQSSAFRRNRQAADPNPSRFMKFYTLVALCFAGLTVAAM